MIDNNELSQLEQSTKFRVFLLKDQINTLNHRIANAMNSCASFKEYEDRINQLQAYKNELHVELCMIEIESYMGVA